MKVDTYQVTVTFLTDVLGSQGARDVMSEYVARANGVELDDEEGETLPDKLDRATTVFNRDKLGNPILMDYQIKGFLKEAGRVLNGKSGLPKNLRAKVSSLVFVSPRQIKLATEGDETEYLERPLRAETAKGPRVALARSEMLPAGTSCQFGLSVLPGEIDENVLRELLDYGYYQGLGQWRGGGWGSFRYDLVREVE